MDFAHCFFSFFFFRECRIWRFFCCLFLLDGSNLLLLLLMSKKSTVYVVSFSVFFQLIKCIFFKLEKKKSMYTVSFFVTFYSLHYTFLTLLKNKETGCDVSFRFSFTCCFLIFSFSFWCRYHSVLVNGRVLPGRFRSYLRWVFRIGWLLEQIFSFHFLKYLIYLFHCTLMLKVSFFSNPEDKMELLLLLFLTLFFLFISFFLFFFSDSCNCDLQRCNLYMEALMV